MVVRKDDLHNLIERLQEPDQKTAFDFLQYLIERSERKPLSWEEARFGFSLRSITTRKLFTYAQSIIAAGSTNKR